MPLPILTVEGVTFDAADFINTNSCIASSAATCLMRWDDMMTSEVLIGADGEHARANGARYGFRWRTAKLFDFEVAISGIRLISDMSFIPDSNTGIWLNTDYCKTAFQPDYSSRVPQVATFTAPNGVDYEAEVHVDFNGTQRNDVWVGTIGLIVPEGIWTEVTP